MKKENLKTPAILLNMNALKNNMRVYQEMCNENKKELWPMIKTHKSKKLMEMQLEIGATGALCGTLDECEMCCEMGMKKIMYAYPVASKENIERVIELTKKTDFIIRLDNLDGAKMINEMAEKTGIVVSYTIIVDSGLHRFGVLVDNLVEFADQLKKLKNLKLRGISSHPGHVYGATCETEIQKYVDDECQTLSKAKELMIDAGYELEYITSGSTPTFSEAVKDKNINVLHPGNYVFLDSIQLSIKKAEVKDCALTVYATIISHPSEDLFICDAGAKCLGLDQGAHGNSSIVGFGTVIGHPELIVAGLSEEVGKLHIHGETNLKVGDKIEIIPNHSCSTANLCSFYTVVDNGEVVDSIPVDVRGNSFKRI
ncbi:alanine racemase [Fusobacterium perfoetens]|uniref:alanine racemase n=1 Tax=Fusobacterium perfoetens TaxID=852 RepID=UPI001F487F88|nr:alanine racemase [Fusobacterium perfoetens]MCF2612494.1 alanine racemase [Fusobacterium perfoetens]